MRVDSIPLFPIQCLDSKLRLDLKRNFKFEAMRKIEKKNHSYHREHRNHNRIYPMFPMSKHMVHLQPLRRPI